MARKTVILLRPAISAACFIVSARPQVVGVGLVPVRRRVTSDSIGSVLGKDAIHVTLASCSSSGVELVLRGDRVRANVRVPAWLPTMSESRAEYWVRPERS